MRREANIEIFENIQQLCEQNRKLMKAIYTSNMKQKIYLETNESIRLPEKQYERPAQIIVN